MDGRVSITALTALHAVMGAGLGALSCGGFLLLERFGFSGAFGALADAGTLIVVVIGLSSWMAVGAGLSGFILVNVARATRSSR
jgi:hypothetical protein